MIEYSTPEASRILRETVRAPAGTEVVYHRGNLARDRKTDKTVRLLSTAMKILESIAWVRLERRKRKRKRGFEYVAIRTEKK